MINKKYFMFGIFFLISILLIGGIFAQAFPISTVSPTAGAKASPAELKQRAEFERIADLTAQGLLNADTFGFNFNNGVITSDSLAASSETATNELSDMVDAMTFVLSDKTPPLTEAFVNAVNRASGGGSNISEDMTSQQIQDKKAQVKKEIEKKINENPKQKLVYEHLKNLKKSVQVGAGSKGVKVSFSSDTKVSATSFRSENDLVSFDIPPNYDFSKPIIINQGNGKQEISIGGIASSIYIKGVSFPKSQNVNLRILDNGDMEYVALSSIEGGLYTLKYNGKEYLFIADAKGEIIFDPTKGIISGKLGKFGIDSSSNFYIASKNGFELKLDKNQNPLSLNLKQGDSLEMGSFLPIFENIYSNSGDMIVFFGKTSDGKDFLKDYNGNAVLLRGYYDENGNFVRDTASFEFKGLVRATGSLNYEGKTKETNTLFYNNLDDGRRNIFEVLSGDAALSSEKFGVNIQKGDASINLKDSLIEGIDWGFIYKNSKSEEVNGQFSFGNNGLFSLKTGDNSAVLMDFSSFKINQDYSSNSIISNSNTINKLRNDLDVLDFDIFIAKQRYADENDPAILTDPDIHKMNLAKFSLQTELSSREGQSFESLNQELDDYIKQAKFDSNVDLENQFNNLRANIGSRVLAEREANLPRTYSVTNTGISGTSISGTRGTSEKVYFEVDSKGNILSYQIGNGEKVSFNGGDTILPSSISNDPSNVAILRRLSQEGATLENLRKISSRTLDEGLTRGSEEYNDYLKLADQVKQDALASKTYFEKIRDKEEAMAQYATTEEEATIAKEAAARANEAAIGAAFTYLKAVSTVDSSAEAEAEFNKIIESNKDNPAVVSEAFRMMSMNIQERLNAAGSSESPEKRGELINGMLSSMRDSISADANNPESNARMQKLLLNYLGGQIEKGVAEGKFIGEDVANAIRVSSTNPESGSGKVAETVLLFFQPATNFYTLIREESLLKEMQGRYNENDIRRDGYREAKQLIGKGVDLFEYANGDTTTRLGMMLRGSVSDTLISTDVVMDVIKQDSINLNNPGSDANFNSEVNRLISRLRESDSISRSQVDEYAKRLNEVFARMSVFKTATQTNPDLYMLVTNGKKVSGLNYEGTADLTTAFTTDRVGNPIQNTWVEAIGMFGGDFAANYALTGGASAFLKGTAIKMGASASRTYNALNGVLNPGTRAMQYLAGEGLGAGLAGTALDLGFWVGTGIGASVAANNEWISPETAAIIQSASNILGVFGGGGQIKGTHLGSARFGDSIVPRYGHFIDDSEISAFAKKLGLTPESGIEGSGFYIGPKGERFVFHVGDELPGGIVPDEFLSVSATKRLAKEAAQRLEDGSKNINERAASIPENLRTAKDDFSNPDVIPETTPGCFLENTKITLADGSYRDIEDLKVGDKVKAYDLVNNQVVDSDIIRTFVRKANSYRVIEYEIIE